ncbi:hypothetical protein IGB42_00192 [Andreprevotia sp. IGB-42]|uniref:hypothetical protein n=1 Tax=Andreprevotia sp. IGB-42 TaxID=2497473 RepID=UPI00157E3DC4|nr:hypothetical protein [Andreprevotia sp. IGB-42]KAF0815115.1 hypothetical protein IGB42_00192 [Andreprevotia sp. IGB-42]
MITPDFATHYYMAEHGPFRSLSDLPLGADDPVFQHLLTRHQHDGSYRRRYGRDYIAKRRVIEAQLRDLFIARGGKPRRNNPFYMVLGSSPWFGGLNDGHQSLQIALSQLDPATTSLTFPDSFIALTREDKPYFKQIFLLDEVAGLTGQFGVPSEPVPASYERYWESDFEFYVEIQLWDEPHGLITGA